MAFITFWQLATRVWSGRRGRRRQTHLAIEVSEAHGSRRAHGESGMRGTSESDSCEVRETDTSMVHVNLVSNGAFEGNSLTIVLDIGHAISSLLLLSKTDYNSHRGQ